ncbi:MAG TPA: formylmethionine deformylase [Firmicutes bacterium]|jgi:peptide deformylase|nr:formylmethionine deformylase [Bacillota bacterium]
MAIQEILLLGDQSLYQVSREVAKEQLVMAQQVSNDLRDTLFNFRTKYGFGRAIAAPQIGEFLRLIYMNFEGQSYTLINPQLEFGSERIQLWDDCMSFPGLEVEVNRFRRTKISYKDLQWNDCNWEVDDDLSELIQHEYDHLDGILAVQRAIDNRSFRINKRKTGCF